MISLIVNVKPGVFKDGITMDEEGVLTIKIREKPIDGAANDYLLKFLAKEWNLCKRDIVLEKGLSSHYKKLLLNMTESELIKIVSKYKK